MEFTENLGGLEGAAFQSRLPYNELSPEERDLFPDVASDVDGHLGFLNIRNRILQMWLDNPKIELIYEVAVQRLTDLKEITPENVALSLKIHKYLERHGFINFGIFKRIHPIRKIKKAKVVVIGAGMAGLAAARQLTSFGMEVISIEARDRVGGRVSTFRKGKFVADLGAMVVTGLGGNPITVISKQINMELHKIKQDCPLYETGGSRVPKEKDVLVEKEFNKLLEATAHLSHEMEIDKFKDKQLSLGKAFELVISLQEKSVKEQLLAHWHQIAKLHERHKDIVERMATLKQKTLKSRDGLSTIPTMKDMDDKESEKAISNEFRRRCLMKDCREACKDFFKLNETRQNLESEIVAMEHNLPSDVYLSSKDRQLLDWHLANLEFANAAPLDKLSLKHWNQDDAYEFSGSHLVVRNGYSILPTAYADGLDIRLSTTVRKMSYSDTGCSVVIQSTQTASPQTTITCDAILCTLPLGVLNPPDPELDHGPAIEFDPPLPSWKIEAMKRMGFGNLNKVVLCFDRNFWESASANLFGHIGATTSSRGELFLFWAIYRAPVLIALVAGKSANVMEHVGDGVVLSRAIAVLKGIFGPENVPDPVNYTVTRWGSDPWAKGSYSYVAVGSSGDDYDVMACPVDGAGASYEQMMSSSGNPRLFFAGEHTMRNYPATVHGALLSGFREAARITDIFVGPITTNGNNQQGPVVTEITDH
ncbi:lysine-specific histone demethylase 1A [Ciona intestinalis]